MHIVYDDGAGLTKAAVSSNGMQVMSAPALVLPVDTGVDEEYLQRADVTVITHNGERYLVGESARAQGATGYSTSNYRYTDTDASVRFCGALSALLSPGEHTARLVVGANVEAYQALKSQIQDFFTGVHQFERNGKTYVVTIEEAHVTSQPRGAVMYFTAHPPASLKQNFQRIALHRANIIGIDVGTFTTDLIALRPERRGDGSTDMQEIFRYSKALRFGVDTLRQKVAVLVQSLQGSPRIPELWEVDRAIESRVATIDGRDEDITTEVNRERDKLWRRTYEQIRAHFEGFNTNYLLVVGGGATGTTFGPCIRESWEGRLPLGIPEQHAPHEAPVRGYAEMAMRRWEAVNV